jgi:3-methyladenine DNA glycosylase AlkC
MKAQTTFSLKDQLFNAEKVAYLTALIEGPYPDFPAEAFAKSVISAFPALELKERVAHMAATLRACLPDGYPDALAVILEALPPELDPDRTDNDFGDFIIAPFSLFVARYGCTAEHLEISLDALREITKRFSAEDAVRYFLNAFPTETLASLGEFAIDHNYHVRRLASESSRPFLPWAQRVAMDYREPLPILDVLFADRTRYVTRSVANHLNDISKIDPDIVLDTLRRWSDLGEQDPAEMKFITRHALRTLVKGGHAAALQVVGFGGEPDVTITELATTTPQVRLGDAFRFSLTVRANAPQRLLIGYVMTFAGERGRASRKVFKLKEMDLKAQEVVTLTKVHPMRPMTTRSLKAGKHLITLEVNGRPKGSLAFDLFVE